MISRIIQKPVSVMIVFTLLVALGIFCGKNLSLDMFPETNNPSVMVTTTCANADPAEVERNVTRKLESAFSGLSGLKHISSESSTGYSQITLEFSSKTDMDTAMNDVREKIDRARGDLPEMAGNPNAIQLDASLISLMTLVMKGDHSPAELYSYADDIVAPALEQIDGIASCDIYGGEEKCIRVSVSLDRLEAYSLSLSQVRQSLASQNLESSAGIISAGKTNYTVSADGAFRTLEDVGHTVVAYSGGATQPIFLRDIADIFEDSKDVYSVAYLDGVPCIMFTLQKQGGRNSVAAAHAVRAALPKILAQLPDDIEIIETANNTDIIESTVSEVISSVVTGALLAIVVLFLFLKNFKSTLIIGLSIPVSIIITLVFMYFRGTSLNLISLSGLLLGGGMLVDNSIVVLENIYTHAAKGESPLESALNGSKEMVMPVISSTLTSVCIFVPMLAFGSLIGIIGEAFLDLGFAISVALICSLFTSIVLVPVLAAYYLKVNPSKICNSGLSSESQDKKTRPHLPRVNISANYTRLVRWILHHKALSFASLIVLFVVAMFSLPARGFILLPSNPETQVKVEMTLAKGTSIEETEEQVKELEKLALSGIEGVTFSNVSVGGTSAAQSNKGTLLLSLSGPYSNEAKEILRTYFDRFPGATFAFQATSLSLSSGFSGGRGGYVLEMHSANLDTLSKTAEEIANLIKNEAGDIVSEVSSDILGGLPEVKIRLDREAVNALGLSINSISSELRAALRRELLSRTARTATS